MNGSIHDIELQSASSNRTRLARYAVEAPTNATVGRERRGRGPTQTEGADARAPALCTREAREQRFAPREVAADRGDSLRSGGTIRHRGLGPQFFGEQRYPSEALTLACESPPVSTTASLRRCCSCMPQRQVGTMRQPSRRPLAIEAASGAWGTRLADAGVRWRSRVQLNARR